jgi:SAM-dependent methyltransferase/uncharacterized protein YbaR (Trm112 family)
MITRALVERLFWCPGCKKSGLETVPFDSDGELVVNGVLSCRGCGMWFPVRDGLAELLLPALRVGAEAFVQRFRSKWDGWSRSAAPASVEGDEHKLEQKSFYDEDAISYESSMLQQSFWKGLDVNSIESIARLAPGGGFLLEIGCGTGRISIPMSSRFQTVAAFDISETMVRTAMRKRGDKKHVVYFVADAENIPLREGLADAAVLYGILHHVGSPSSVLAEAWRCLKPGAGFFGCENNRSFFRPVFDLLMRVRKLWSEKAHEEHFILSHAGLKGWLDAQGFKSRVWTSVFLPPHFFNLLSASGSAAALRATDRLCLAFPWLRWQGGLVMFQGVKPG